ncbi:hypothetical protein KUTeg_013329 [Tegillarca granosa]|uniref:Galactose mutarotase n=1 Tax=Tegillarca granosa TaxID=220873 RepID=A0ABQ9EXD0_TEGGR|nr:hypothetical protein KUTeg_013329 [Tegillarca granosa]
MPTRESRRHLLCAVCWVLVVIVVLLAVIIYLATKEPDCKDDSSSVTIETTKYGSIDGKQVYRYTFKNKNKIEVSIISYGGIVTNILVPDKNGKVEDIVLGYDSIEGFKSNGPYFGAIIGRYANRIAKGRFSIDGVNYTLAINNPPNSLHGGVKGFDKRVWKSSLKDDKLILKYTSSDKEEGFPGEVITMVTYQLTDNNELIIEYSATTSKKTVINLTNHAYFNLAGQGSGNIFEHKAIIKAEHYTPVDSTSIPTGQLASVSGTMFDLRTAVSLGDRIPKVPGNIGFDINYSFGKTGWMKYGARLLFQQRFWRQQKHTCRPPSINLVFYLEQK